MYLSQGQEIRAINYKKIYLIGNEEASTHLGNQFLELRTPIPKL